MDKEFIKLLLGKELGILVDTYDIVKIEELDGVKVVTVNVLPKGKKTYIPCTWGFKENDIE